MNAKVVELDPDWAKKERRSELRFWAALAAAIIAIGIGTWAAIVNGEQGNEITQIQHSACQTHPAGEECQKAKAASSRAASVATTCISFRIAGYPCPKPGSAVAKGGDAESTPTHTGSSQPGPPSSGPAEQPSTELGTQPEGVKESPEKLTPGPVDEAVEGVGNTAHEVACALPTQLCP